MKNPRKKVWLIVAGALITTQVWAQDEQNAATAYSERELSEIVVYGSREADSAFVDPAFEAVWREQRLEQSGRERVEEANEWRAALTYPLSGAPNIVLGFDPKFDLQRRQDLNLFSVPGGTTVAATLIRGAF